MVRCHGPPLLAQQSEGQPFVQRARPTFLQPAAVQKGAPDEPDRLGSVREHTMVEAIAGFNGGEVDDFHTQLAQLIRRTDPIDATSDEARNRKGLFII